MVLSTCIPAAPHALGFPVRITLRQNAREDVATNGDKDAPYSYCDWWPQLHLLAGNVL